MLNPPPKFGPAAGGVANEGDPAALIATPTIVTSVQPSSANVMGASLIATNDCSGFCGRLSRNKKKTKNKNGLAFA